LALVEVICASLSRQLSTSYPNPYLIQQDGLHGGGPSPSISS
jgi:hypothetical protein